MSAAFEPAFPREGQRAGESSASVGSLFAVVHDKLRQIAAAQLARERAGHTLQPTALVHEAYLKLAGRSDLKQSSPDEVYAAAAEAMRCVLIDHARGKGRVKRGGGRKHVPLDVLELAAEDDPAQILALDEAFRCLEERDPRMAQVAKLRLYARLSDQEIAKSLGVSDRTVRREWAVARAFLHRALTGD